MGVSEQSAQQPGGPSVGLMADIGGRPGVHPAWLFHFRVTALDPAVCDDPQGAAFALRERPPRADGRPI
jgi:hypothetical protein